MELTFYGLPKEDLERIKSGLEAIGESSMNMVQTGEATRSGAELLSAAFILGAIKASPALIKALTEVLTEIRKTYYFTIKITSTDGSTSVEGAATPARIEQLTKLLAQK